MSDVTRILSAIEQGDPTGAEQLLPLVYEELRKLAAQRMAQEKPGQTLQAIALVHEAYVRLADAEKAQHWNSRGHFFSAAAEAMRRVLVENARRKGRQKRGGEFARVELQEADLVVTAPSDQLLAVDEALRGLRMSEAHEPLNPDAQGDEVVARLLEEITQKIEAREPVDLETYEREYPQHIQRIRQAVPALQALSLLAKLSNF